jgi:hypothetical protein
MPFASKQQAKEMFSAASGNSTLGIPKKVGQEFVNASAGMKIGKLPKFKKPSVRRPGPGMPGAQPFGSLAPGGGMDPGAPPATPDGEMQ